MFAHFECFKLQFFAEIKIQNVVVCARFDIPPDLDSLENLFNGIAHQPKGFASVNLKDEVSTLCQVFKNGKVIVIGGKSLAASREIFDNYLTKIAQAGFDTSHTGFCVQNIIGKYDFGHRLNFRKLASGGALTKLVSHNGLLVEYLEYEPESFSSAVRYRMRDPKVTANIFYSGKVILLGAKNLKDLEAAYTRVHNLLKDGKYNH